MRSYMNLFKTLPIIPGFKHPTAHEMGQIDFSGGSISVLKPQPVSLTGLHLNWTDH